MLLEATLDNGKIKDALISDTLYRGFEQILIGRSAMDMPYITQRICGICSSAHAVTSSLAIEMALGMTVPPNGLLLRNLIYTGDIIQNHIRHLYTMVLPDYFKGPDIAPFVPHFEGDDRLSPKENVQFIAHYFKSFEIARAAHAAFAVFGGKAPHGHGIIPGGITMDIDADKINRYRGYLKDIIAFIQDLMIPDILFLADRYPEYVDIGKGNGNYMSVGGFTGLDGGNLFPSGVVIQGKKGEFNEKKVTEDVTTAWYKQTGPLYPGDGQTVPDRNQPKAYTWVKAPRYQGDAMEVGPLARAIIAGEQVIGHGAIARSVVRAMETQKIALAAMDWLEQLHPKERTLNTTVKQETGIGIGLHEAMRGALGHWVSVKDGRIKQYQIVTPSAWTFSSRDENGTRSVAESSLIDLTIATPELKEAGRVIRSYDPCFSCSVHLIEGKKLHTLNLPV